jgi:2-polyprenyl-6-methoxyphenol hydroxylase-like FAD-dependent oxidoreductase
VNSGRVLVVGAGVAGLATAAALQTRGVPFALADRLEGLPGGGLGLNLPGNAVLALRALGVDLAGLGMPITRREYRNGTGRLLFSVDESAFWGAAAGPICVRRGDLLATMARGMPAAAVRWGSAVSSLANVAEGVEVSFSDGHREMFDLVVGADGVHSAVRSALFGAVAPRPALLSGASWRFTVQNPGVDCWVVWSGGAGTFLLIPIEAAEVYGYASATRGGPVAEDPEWLRTVFGRFPDPVPRTVEAILVSPASLYHSPVLEVRTERWSQGRVVLIGDAAHATAPVWAQGAALAAEDALVLADLLTGPTDWSGVGAEFERRRRPRVEHVRSMTDKLSRAARLPGWLRDAVLPIIGPRTYRETYGPLREPVL